MPRSLNGYSHALKAPLLSGSLATVLVAAGLAYLSTGRVNIHYLLTCLVGAAALSAGVALFSDYYNAGRKNNPAPSGRRSANRRFFLVMSLICVAIAVVLGWWLAAQGRSQVVWWGLAGLAAGAAYLLLPARPSGRGLATLTAFLACGPILTMAAYYVLTGSVTIASVAIGIPSGLTIGAAVWIRGLPDKPAKQKGLGEGRWLYLFLILTPFPYLFWLALGQGLGWLTLIGLAPLPLALAAVTILARRDQTPETIILAQVKTIQNQAALSLLLALALFGERFFRV